MLPATNPPLLLLISESKTGNCRPKFKFSTKKWWGDNQEGMTLVEVLVSLFLFGIALGSLMFLLTTILTSADELRNNTVASGLAEEGLEVVMAIRDQDWIASRTFGTNLPDGNWEVQWNSDSLTPNSSRFVKKNSATGMFSYDTGIDTGFKRTITISTANENNENEKIVQVLISWQSNNGNPGSLKAESHLFNWR